MTTKANQCSMKSKVSFSVRTHLIMLYLYLSVSNTEAIVSEEPRKVSESIAVRNEIVIPPEVNSLYISPHVGSSISDILLVDRERVFQGSW